MYYNSTFYILKEKHREFQVKSPLKDKSCIGPSLYSVYAMKHNGFRIHVFSVLLLNTRISVGMVVISGF